jgi:hypothetical protein
MSSFIRGLMVSCFVVASSVSLSQVDPRPSPEVRAPMPSSSRSGGSVLETYAKGQKEHERRQRAWERKLKALTGGICTGC